MQRHTRSCERHSSQNGLENCRRESCFTRTVLLHTGSVVAMAVVRDGGLELVDHPPYSPDLAPSDYFLFPNMKENKRLAGKQYRSDDEVILQLRTFPRLRMRASLPWESKRCNTEHRRKKRVDGRGDYVEIWIRPLHHSQPMNFFARPRNANRSITDEYTRNFTRFL